MLNKWYHWGVSSIIVCIGRGPAQDSPFDIVLWYIAKNSYFVGIGPILDVELTCIFDLDLPFVRSIKDMYQCYNINF